MEYYTLDGIDYLRYYILLLYYRFAEMPPVVRLCAIFTTLCIITYICLVVGNLHNSRKASRMQRKSERYSNKYKDRISELIMNPETIEVGVMSDELGLSKNFRMKPDNNRALIPLLREIFQEHKDKMNKNNWQRMLMAFKMPAYFENQLQSRSTKKRIAALMDIASIDANLKEAVASRHLFSKDKKMMMNARFHVARFGTSYPFKALEEDANLVFTEEMMVKYHSILQYRYDNGMSLPNLIRWCNRQPVNEELRIFAVNEIRLFKRYDDCQELLAMLKDCRDEKFSCALIRALGELEYIPAESELRRRYAGASFLERQSRAEALGAINSGNPQVVDYLVYDYQESTDYASKMKALRVLYNYGRRGREAFMKLKKEASDRMLFDHIECDLIDSRKYA